MSAEAFWIQAEAAGARGAAVAIAGQRDERSVPRDPSRASGHGGVTRSLRLPRHLSAGKQACRNRHLRDHGCGSGRGGSRLGAASVPFPTAVAAAAVLPPLLMRTKETTERELLVSREGGCREGVGVGRRPAGSGGARLAMSPSVAVVAPVTVVRRAAAARIAAAAAIRSRRWRRFRPGWRASRRRPSTRR